MDDERKEITISEAVVQWGAISQLPNAMHFGQYVKDLETKGYKILYSEDQYGKD